MPKMLIFLAILAATALPMRAALGGSAESIIVDQTRFHAKRSVVERREFTVHEISRDDGTLIREYVAPNGKVFGVSWSGPAIPDLTQLLGTYNTEFQNTLRGKRDRRKVAVIRNSDLVVESSGHTRAFFGRAYVNSMLPSGVTQDMVK